MLTQTKILLLSMAAKTFCLFVCSVFHFLLQCKILFCGVISVNYWIILKIYLLLCLWYHLIWKINLKSFYLPKLMSGWKFSLLISVSFGRGGGKKSHRKVTFISKQKCFRTFLQFLHFLNRNTINYKAKIVHRALVKV